MDFESPDVEREFPGLYASESGSGKRSQESDFSDDAHERNSLTKKDLLIGKRKEKKESKKDQGYAALEGESSPEEDVDVKSPCKSKKSKSFKFPTIKEKREKSREKDIREKEKDKDKDKDSDKDRDKEKKKESKSKLKLRDKKKIKSGDDSAESLDEMPVFGVSLSVAVNRSHCHDGVAIPLVVRDCIDHVQDCGLNVEGIYKISGVKSKVQQLRRSYNKRESVKLSDYDIPTVTSLLKLFLRELPDPLLTADLASKFEEVAVMKELAAREQELSALLASLPSCNLTCLSWIMRHLENVVANESQNKMSINSVGTVLGPVLQTSPRVVSALLTHSRVLFPSVKLVRYVPPLSAGCTSLPSSKEAIATELTKQESLLNQIHTEMNHGYTVRSDQLWEVQRFITLLKRKLRSLEKAQEGNNQASDKQQIKLEPPAPVSTSSISSVTKVPAVSPSGDKIDFQLQMPPEEVCLKGGTGSDAEDLSLKENSKSSEQKHPIKDEVDSAPNEELEPPVVSASESFIQESALGTALPSVALKREDYVAPAESDENAHEAQLQLEYTELLKLQSDLASRICDERGEVKALCENYRSLAASLPEASVHSLIFKNCETPQGSPEMSADESDGYNCKTKKDKLELCEPNAHLLQERSNQVKRHSLEQEEGASLRVQEKIELCEQNANLLQDRLNLVKQLILEQEACISLRVQLNQLKQMITEPK